MTKPLVNRDNTFSRPDSTYGETISRIALSGVCPFCPEHLHQEHGLPIDERGFWWVTNNKFAYKPSIHHVLIILKRHAEHFKDLSLEEKTELMEIVQLECEKRQIPGGTLIMRFGDTAFTGATVSHLHAHIVQSDPSSPEYDKKQGLKMRIG